MHKGSSRKRSILSVYITYNISIHEKSFFTVDTRTTILKTFDAFSFFFLLQLLLQLCSYLFMRFSCKLLYCIFMEILYSRKSKIRVLCYGLSEICYVILTYYTIFSAIIKSRMKVETANFNQFFTLRK